jgi:hypothetical protein
VRNDYGNLLKSSGRVAAAKECYLVAVSQQPNLAVAWNNLGCVSLEEADGPSAIRNFTLAIYHDPQLECSYTNLVCGLHGPASLYCFFFLELTCIVFNLLLLLFYFILYCVSMQLSYRLGCCDSVVANVSASPHS